MKLAAYLAENKLTHAQFAALIGTTQVAISRYANGLRRPADEIEEKIIAVTNGQVTADDLRAARREKAAA